MNLFGSFKNSKVGKIFVDNHFKSLPLLWQKFKGGTHPWRVMGMGVPGEWFTLKPIRGKCLTLFPCKKNQLLPLTLVLVVKDSFGKHSKKEEVISVTKIPKKAVNPGKMTIKIPFSIDWFWIDAHCAKKSAF